jgi:two-component system response regulator HydG
MAKEKILVVDDEASHRTMLNAVLSSEGYQIFEADDGKTAIEAVEREFYDLFLIDVRMTELDGIEAMQEIKKISPTIPIIIMTAYGSVKTGPRWTPSNRMPMITSQSLWI